MADTNDVVATTIKTYEELADDYHKAHCDIKEVKIIADYFIQNLKGDTVLDIGCGAGRDAKFFSDHGLQVIGIDLTSRFVKMAALTAPNAKFRQMDMRNINFPKTVFDGIWVCASFLHIPKNEAKKTLLGFKKLLSPMGYFIFLLSKGSEKNSF